MFDLDPGAANITPSKYRQVSIADDVPGLAPEQLERHFVGREAYRRTRFVLARQGTDVALVEIDREPSGALFSDITAARVLADRDECVFVRDEGVDAGVPSQLAAVADRHPTKRCVVVEDRYSHVNFILNPEPVRIDVVDVAPPYPAKLVHQVGRVLDVAEDLPPVVARDRTVDSHELLRRELPDEPRHLLVPCRASGIAPDGMETSALDERPELDDWTLLGCTRSQQIHRWFYGADVPVSVDTCARRLVAPDLAAPTLTRCCLLEAGLERDGRVVVVPWGASLGEVRSAIDALVDAEEHAWTPT